MRIAQMPLAKRSPQNMYAVRVALLIANGWWREVGSDTLELCRVAAAVLAVVSSSYL
jgi:hypothetical protein